MWNRHQHRFGHFCERWFKIKETSKEYDTLVCLFDRDFHRFEPATELTLSAEKSDKHNVTEAQVSQGCTDRSVRICPHCGVFDLEILSRF